MARNIGCIVVLLLLCAVSTVFARGKTSEYVGDRVLWANIRLDRFCLAIGAESERRSISSTLLIYWQIPWVAVAQPQMGSNPRSNRRRFREAECSTEC